MNKRRRIVADTVIRRRFDAGMRNYENVYRRLVDTWGLYDYSEPAPRLIASGDNP